MTWRSAGLPAAPLLSVCCWLTAHQSRCATRRSAAHGGRSEDWRHRVCYHVPLAQTGVPRPRSLRVGRAGVHEVGAGARSCCSRLTRVVSSFSWPVVLTAPLLVSFYSFLVCWRSAGGAGMVVVVVVLVKRLMAREKRRQELRLRAAVQNKTSRPLPTPERACPGEVKPEPPPAGPTRGVYQVS